MLHARSSFRVSVLARLVLASGLIAAAGFPAARADDLAALEAARAHIVADSPDEATRQAALAQLDAARAQQREAATLRARLATLRAEAAERPARVEDLRALLGQDREQALADWAAQLPEDADGETLERLLAQERVALDALAARIDAAGAELALAVSRPAQAAGEIAGLRRRLEALAVAPPAVEGEPAAVAEARRLRVASESARVQAELELRLAEQDSSSPRQQLIELTLAELRMQRSMHQQRIELLQSRIAELGERQVALLIERLAERADQQDGLRGAAAITARENAQLGSELLTQTALLARDRAGLAGYEQDRDRLVASLRDSRTRLELGGTSDAVGRWLWSERRRLEPPARLRQRLEETRRGLGDLRLGLIIMGEQRHGLLDLDAAARALAEASREQVDDDGERAITPESLRPLLADRQELLDQLQPVLQRRLATLEQAERTLQEQLDATVSLRQLLDRHLLWTPSHLPIGPDWLVRVPEGLQDLVKPSRFATTWTLVQRELGARPLRWLTALLLLLVLYQLRRRAPARIRARAVPARGLQTDSLPATLQVFGWTVIAALPAPAALAMLGLLLQSVGNPGRYSDSLGQACMMLVLPLFAVQLLRWTLLELGLAHAHFRWRRPRREALRRAVPRAAAVILPMHYIVSLAFIRNLDLPNDVQARLAAVVAAVALAWTLWWLLDTGRLFVVRGAASEAGALRKLLRLALPAASLAVAGLALAGYVYSAAILLKAMLATFVVAVAIALLMGLLARGLLLGERRLAQLRNEERRAAAGEDADEHAEAEADLTLEQINAQTGRLLRALRLSLVAGGLFWVWVPVLPAFARLDEIPLWSVLETAPDGSSMAVPVTLAGALLGLLALALMTVGARNLPGLVEIGLLSRTRIDAASRYAITSVLRYAIVIFGLLVGLSLLGLRWSQLQWLAAALTFGLAFGLQEIFANFVSGLILLFERPFRVGDVITVGEFSGRVTRIRTRATTIQDFDNREIVIPNKNFITGQLTNWTLTDTTTRVTIKVGVAYGTDPARVRELLLSVAREQSLVLTEPEPKSWFLAFGASSLDFELRVYVANVADRLPVQDALNTRIAALFAEHGIVIAFPQLDLHVRELPPPGAPAQA
jgi:potassium-dependent mechanosensitive channel